MRLFFSRSLLTMIEFLEYRLVFVIFSSSFKLLNSPATPSNKSLFLNIILNVLFSNKEILTQKQYFCLNYHLRSHSFINYTK